MPFELLQAGVVEFAAGYRVDVDITVIDDLRESRDKLEPSHDMALIGEDEASRSRTTYVTLSWVPVQ